MSIFGVFPFHVAIENWKTRWKAHEIKVINTQNGILLMKENNIMRLKT